MSIHLNQSGNVFHEGERRMHRRLGIEDRQHELGLRVIREYMPDQHREFFETLRAVHLGAVDQDGHPWAILRTGHPGFMHSPNEKTLVVSSQPLAGEPDGIVLTKGAKVSVLGLELETRRRNRMNATVSAVDGEKLHLAVDQSYGNCPKYIQVRLLTEDGAISAHQAHRYMELTSQDRSAIESADTLMLATRAPDLTDDPRAGVDINHRGGMPGFVKVLNDQTVEFPDYKGNSFFNSLGNILLDNRVGLQFWEFETGTLLNLKGTAELIERSNTVPPLMGQSLRVHIEEIVRAEGAVPLRYDLAEYSPQNPATAS